uniref:Uncharacterized protein n=1 Tax=viral metagenome TaxID=1070528 RepID=A0A6C0DJU4_9ZZZZ
MALLRFIILIVLAANATNTTDLMDGLFQRIHDEL